MKWIERNIKNGKQIQKFFSNIFVINLIITPVICVGWEILGIHWLYGMNSFVYWWGPGIGITYEEFFLWIFIGIVSFTLSPYSLFKDKDEGN